MEYVQYFAMKLKEVYQYMQYITHAFYDKIKHFLFATISFPIAEWSYFFTPN